MEHTPGPWVEYRSTKYLGRGITSTAVDIWHVNGDGDTTRVADGIGTVMDARLIAAALDLLAALEDLLETTNVTPRRIRIARARAAIRKARREE